MSENLGVSSAANVLIHPSQFPDAIRRDLITSLRTRQVNHKFHYDSVRQTQKWLALHQEYSPSRNDADCAATYDAAFAGAQAKLQAAHLRVIGLGCGGGQKDMRLLKSLKSKGAATTYTPCDVSTAMVLVAREAALTVISDEACTPLVCDLATTDDLPAVVSSLHAPQATRLVTFFGMIPNFEPQDILTKLAALVRPNDWFLFSANLAPGKDYAAGVRRILPQYDNALTHEWLITFLLDLGVERSDGELRFAIEDNGALKRIIARFHFSRDRRIKVEDEAFEFRAGETIQLFFSYRYTPERVRTALAQHGLSVQSEWITQSEEEGVFLCQRSA